MTFGAQPAIEAEDFRVLLVEDDAGLQRQMRWALAPVETVSVDTRAEALRLFRDQGPFDIVVLDLGLPPDPDGATEGLKTLNEILAVAPDTKVIVVSGNAVRKNAVDAVGRGAFDFIAKPVDIDELKLVIARARRMKSLEEENRALRSEGAKESFGLVFRSPQMMKVQKLIERVGTTDVSALILGETGTGKEMVGRALHEASHRRSKRFVALNCASIPENLLESELFGHERGAFTGAVKQTPGKVELANGGTLFLDEIGDMPIALQAKLLRFLQDKQFERVGGRTSIAVDVRVVSATNRALESLLSQGSFREDLFYRLNGVRIDLPPLREREGDALLLGHHFLNLFSRQNNRLFRGFSEDGVRAIANHRWPGNIRELENRVRRAVIMCDGNLIAAADLELDEGTATKQDLCLRTATERLERMLVTQALAVSRNNISKAAKELGVSRPHLYKLMRSLGISGAEE
ncbi:MAG TPA: PEP-CTERM-box response regulator transcription factor [Rhizomicrobium sp.]|nr:PEP-CTERM-box response regulator transcription factor [Rhizomicrobium sp.]